MRGMEGQPESAPLLQLTGCLVIVPLHPPTPDETVNSSFLVFSPSRDSSPRQPGTWAEEFRSL